MGKKTKNKKKMQRDADPNWEPSYIKEMQANFNKRVNADCAEASSRQLERRAQQILAQLQRPLLANDMQALYRELIALTGTRLEINDQDPFGDGDQRRLPTDQKAQIFRNIWNMGGDVAAHLQMGTFSKDDLISYCVKGNKQQVEAILKSASSPEARRKLLEERHTVFRTPPLLLIMGIAKHFSQGFGVRPGQGPPNASQVDFPGVAAVLLQYGARPNAKDVAGKTAVHWGAGGVCTETTRQIADYCIRAARSCQHFGRNVEIQGLANKPEYNGLTGILGGYLVDVDRRAVTVKVDGKNRELSLRPKNIFFNGTCILKESCNLVDVPDRLGAVALHEVVMNSELDTAKFLCKKHHASVDIAEINGTTVRQMAMMSHGGLESPSLHYIKREACQQNVLQTCAQGQKQEVPDAITSKPEKRFMRCRCGPTFYCSKDCQLAHWPIHKQQCSKKKIKLAKPSKQDLIKQLNLPKDIKLQSFNHAGAFDDDDRYRAPDGVNANEKFWVKVQCTPSKTAGHHMVYDESRTCSFTILPGQPGYSELQERVHAEKASLGRKTHFQAKFDEKGDCYVYPATATLKKW